MASSKLGAIRHSLPAKTDTLPQIKYSRLFLIVRLIYGELNQTSLTSPVLSVAWASVINLPLLEKKLFGLLIWAFRQTSWDSWIFFIGV